MTQEIVFDGGSGADRKRVVELQQAYLDANATFDWVELSKIWSHNPTNVYFNMNGHTYVGLPHWTSLWKYYRERIDTGLWEPYELSGLVLRQSVTR